LNFRITHLLDTPALLATDHSAVFRYGAATVAVLAAFGVRLALNPLLGPYAPYLPLALGIMFAARIGGRGPGLAATALSTLGVSYLFIEPQFALSLGNHGEFAGLVLFALVGVLISLLIGHLRESLLSIARAEESLRRKTQLLDLSHDAIVTADSSRRVTSWNAGATEMYGWTASEAVGTVMPELLHTGSGFFAAIGEILNREGRWDGELNQVARDGRRLIVESRQVLLRDSRNAPAGILEINRDVTETRRAAEALHESEAQFRTLANVIPQLCWMANGDGWIFWYNDRWYEYTGTTSADMEGWGWQSVHDQEELPKVLGAWKESIASGQPFEMVFPLRGADGVFHPFLTRVMPVRDGDGRIVRWFGTNTDISDQQRTEEALRRAYEQRGLALEAAQLGAWDYRFDTGEVFWDERCRNMFGISTGGQIEYDAAIARIHGDDQDSVNQAVKQAIAGGNGGAYHREYRVVWPDGSVRWVASHGQAFFEGQGDQRHAVRFAGVNMDVTDRKYAEERLRQTQKLESIGLLAGGVAHDFNNILTVIMGSASTALEECPTCEHSKSILSASERAAYLTRQLLAYAGKGHNVLKLVDLTEIVSRSTELLMASVPKRVALRFNLSPDLPYLEADPSCMEQILMNLAINAGEAIPSKTDGLIEIETKSIEVTPAMARLHSPPYDVAAGPYVCLEVRDNGEGMEQATMARIFDPFFTTKFTGRGLGLAALQGIVRTSKGFVEVRSSAGRGTTFRVFLPASDKKRLTERPRTTPQREVSGTATILVVDDEEMVRKLASLTLRRYGYEVQEAHDGQDALRVLAESVTLPSLALLDLAMPVLGGDELVPILRAKYPSLKILISSGYPEEEARKLSPKGSIAGFLQKPYTSVALAERITQALEGR
jgi:two-component system cell cycle sensor histidine kinase/response regulator CckA